MRNSEVRYTVLVVNCGSSSLKFAAVGLDAAAESCTRLASGRVERIGSDAAVSFQVYGGSAEHRRHPVSDHGGALRLVLEWLRGGDSGVSLDRLLAVGHRVVHGGDYFTQPVLIEDTVMARLDGLAPLAPLHNPPSLLAIREARKILGLAVPMVAVFDTAFHRTVPPHAAQYALPHELAARHRVRRYGFHGIAHAHAATRFAELTGRALEEVTIITLHLGNGCSATAVQDGRSIDTSMGFTPLEGLVMGTRSGDIDPSVVPYLARAEGVSAETVLGWLNDRSGLFGVSGGANDVRDVLARIEASGDSRARLAVDMFCYRARKYVGAYLAALGGAAAVVFSGGIGEHAPEIRARICAGLEWAGLRVDAERNARALGTEARISTDESWLHAYVVLTDEEIVIARETARCVRERARSEVR